MRPDEIFQVSQLWRRHDRAVPRTAALDVSGVFGAISRGANICEPSVIRFVSSVSNVVLSYRASGLAAHCCRRRNVDPGICASRSIVSVDASSSPRRLLSSPCRLSLERKLYLNISRWHTRLPSRTESRAYEKRGEIQKRIGAQGTLVAMPFSMPEFKCPTCGATMPRRPRQPWICLSCSGRFQISQTYRRIVGWALIGILLFFLMPSVFEVGVSSVPQTSCGFRF